MEDFSIESLTRLFQLHKEEDFFMEASGSAVIEVPFELTARDFLKFAETDVNDSRCEHHLVNALSNIKRAIDCQLDSLLFGFGLLDMSKKENWNFPKKTDVLTEAGIILPTVLKRINQKRNLLEHEYRNPEKEQVQDAFDVATLFLAYTDKFLFHALVDCDLYFEAEPNPHLEVELRYKENKIVFSTPVWSKEGKRVGSVTKEVVADSKEYSTYLKWFVNLYECRL